MKVKVKKSICLDCGKEIYINKYASKKTRCDGCKDEVWKIKYEKIKKKKETDRA